MREQYLLYEKSNDGFHVQFVAVAGHISDLEKMITEFNQRGRRWFIKNKHTNHVVPNEEILHLLNWEKAHDLLAAG